MSLLLLLLHSLAHFDAIILLSIILDYRCIRVKELKKKKKGSFGSKYFTDIRKTTTTKAIDNTGSRGTY